LLTNDIIYPVENLIIAYMWHSRKYCAKQKGGSAGPAFDGLLELLSANRVRPEAPCTIYHRRFPPDHGNTGNTGKGRMGRVLEKCGGQTNWKSS
jgi:hypothetical protein